jgi:hypothetical protein
MILASLLLSLTLNPPPSAFYGPKPESGEKVIQKGIGNIVAGPDDLARVHYVVFDKEWHVTDFSVEPGFVIVRISEAYEPWRSSLMKMVAGEQRATWLPNDGGVIVTEMVSVIHPPERPADMEPPADAIKSENGCAYKVLKAGSGRRPGGNDTVRVTFTAWTSDGKIFDTALARGGAQSFTMDSAGSVFGPALALMSEGERALFWIPAKLVFGEDPAKPQGTMVYDVELQQIVPTPAPKAATVPRSIPEPPPVKLKPPVPRRP